MPHGHPRMTIPFRTRFSAQLVAALSVTPMNLAHAALVIAWIAVPLNAAIEEDLPALLILFWSPLALWLMTYFAAKSEVESLPELFTDAIANKDANAASEVVRLLRLLGTSDRRRMLDDVLAIDHAISGRHDEAIPLLERAPRSDSSARERADRAYWLAVAYRALGREDDARASFVVAAKSDGPFARDARRMLETASPFRG